MLNAFLYHFNWRKLGWIKSAIWPNVLALINLSQKKKKKLEYPFVSEFDSSHLTSSTLPLPLHWTAFLSRSTDMMRFVFWLVISSANNCHQRAQNIPVPRSIVTVGSTKFTGKKSGLKSPLPYFRLFPSIWFYGFVISSVNNYHGEGDSKTAWIMQETEFQ